jgi:hypothetical protein
LLARCHVFVRALVTGILDAGGGLVIGIGRDLRLAPEDPDSALLFDWTVVDELERQVKGCPAHPRAIVITSQRNRDQIPRRRLKRWHDLVERGVISLRLRNWRAAGRFRQHQAEAGHGLVILGGGEGVEDLAHRHVGHGHVVVPLDADLPSHRGDGHGGARQLYQRALDRPEEFVLRHPERFRDLLSVISLSGARAPGQAARKVLAILKQHAVPAEAFYARMMNEKHPHSSQVDDYFLRTVGPALAKLGYRGLDHARAKPETAFINTEIFQQLHHADSVVADLTGARPNVYLEVGYAFGRSIPVILTARTGTKRAFDVDAYPVLFWGPDQPERERRKAFIDHWRRTLQRTKLIKPRELG